MMAGTLFVVATPIGHLDDISVRALRVLGTVALVAAEDTRRTGNLLRHFEIPTRLISLHQHNERDRIATLLARLHRGESVAVVSDAGTPGISDPGSELVRRARAEKIRVEPIPGPSAVSAAISVAGLEGTGFAFVGFPPVRSKDRKRWFGDLAGVHSRLAVVLFEAPHRFRKTLEDLSNYGISPIIAMRELTKVHEEIREGTPEELLAAWPAPQGEFTVVIPPSAGPDPETAAITDEQLQQMFGEITKTTPVGSPREAARLVAERLGISTKRVYEATRHGR